jgi:Mg2+ and Co2+ transporter CorA
MTTGTLLKTSFAASLFIPIIGAYLKLTHAQGAETLLMISFIAILIFIVTALYEVNTSKRIDSTEKVMWTVGFLLMSTIAGFVYMLKRRRIASDI